MFILAVGGSFTASFLIRPVIVTNLELPFIWAEHDVLFETEWCRGICCRSRIQLPQNQIFFHLHEYDTGRFLPETAALDPNILSDATEFIAVTLLDDKMLTLSHICVGPRVIAFGCSYCKAKRVYFWPSCESRHAKHCDGRYN